MTWWPIWAVEWTPEGTGLMYSRAKVLHRRQSRRHCSSPWRRSSWTSEISTRCGSNASWPGAWLHRQGGDPPCPGAVINDVFTPSPEEVAHNRRVIEVFDEALAEGSPRLRRRERWWTTPWPEWPRTVIARAEVAEQAAARDSS